MAALGTAAPPRPAHPVQPLRAAQPPEPVAAPAVDEAELAALREQARQAGFAAGQVEGLARGHEQGYAAGLSAGRAAVAEQAAQLATLAQHFTDAVRQLDAEVARSLVQAALDIAQAVVRRDLEEHSDSVLTAVRSALHDEPLISEEPRLHVHPLDAELVTSVLAGELQSAGWHVHADPTIARGGCVVRALNGSFDASIETRWARARAAVIDAETGSA